MVMYMALAYNSRIRHRPLRGSSNAFIQTALVGIIPSIRISQEERIDAASFKQLGQFNPILQAALCG